MITIEGETGVNEACVGEVGLESSLLAVGQPLVVITSGLENDARFTVHSLKGELLHSTSIVTGEQRVNIPLNELTPGIYIYSIRSATQKFFGQFVIK